MKSVLVCAALSIGLGAVCSADIIKSNPPSMVTCKSDGLAPNKVCVGSFAGVTWQHTGYYILQDSPGVTSDILVLKNGVGKAVSQFGATVSPLGPLLGTITEGSSVTLPKLFLLSGTTKVAYVSFLLTNDGGSFPEALKGSYVPVSVPEPATLALVGLGLVGVAMSRRFFRQRAS